MREQAASRQVVDELRATVGQLQERLRRQTDAGASEYHGARLVVRLGGDSFGAGQTDLNAEDRRIVREVASRLRSSGPEATVLVEGHTDDVPVRDDAANAFRTNADLSLLRARAVAAVLIEEGVPEKRLRVRGWGDTRPVAANDTADGRHRNRRVEILLLPLGDRL